MRFDAGNGSCSKFWHDVWCGEAALQESFSDLFCIAQDRDALVPHYMQVRNDSTY